MTKLISLLLVGMVVVTTLGQSKQKRATAKRSDPELIQPCGVRQTLESDLEAGTLGGSPWRLVATSYDENLYYNRNWSCVSNVIKVWVKSTRNADQHATSMSRYELRCNRNQIRIVQAVEYDTDGDVQSSYVDSRVEWRDVVPDSIGETILNTVCQKSHLPN